MLRYLFNRLWQNKLARFATLAFLSLVIFLLIFSARDRLALSFSRFFSSPNWGDVATYAGKPFAFNEDAAKAERLTQEAWKKIEKMAEEKINAPKVKNPITGKIAPRPYSSFLSKDAEENIFNFLNILANNCGSFIADVTITTRTPQQKKAKGNVLQHNITTVMRSLLQTNAETVEMALQKKPDYIPAIDLSEEIFRATCSMREIAPLLSRALDYREYALQKKLYESDSGKTYEKHPELFDAKSNEAYSRDSFYRELLLRYFDATKYRTPYNPAHLKNMREAYARLPNVKTLEALIAALLADAQNNPPSIAQKCHYELFALDYPGVSERPDYLYALAETAVLAGETSRAKNIIANALKSPYIKDETMRRSLMRLRFRLDLTTHESENLSRF